MRSYLARFAAAVLLGSTSAASAGPIAYSYSSTFTNANDPAMGFAYVGPSGTGIGGSYNVAAQLWGWQSTAKSGSGSIQVGTANRQAYFAGTTSPPTWDQNFALTVNFTDVASGQGGAFTFNGIFTAEQGWPSLMSARYTNQWEQTKVIGGNRYEVSLKYTGIGSDLGLFADVQVDAVAQTPEPPAAVMAVVGSAGMGLWILMRRRTAISVAA